MSFEALALQKAFTATHVQIVDEAGRVTTLTANGKRQDRLTGDGEFKSTTKIEAGRLSVEEDFGSAKVTTSYERVTIDESSRLKVTLKVDGIRQPPSARGGTTVEPIIRIYDLTR